MLDYRNGKTMISTQQRVVAQGRLWNRNFLLLWSGQLVSQFGTQAYSIAILFWLKDMTGSATLIGTLLMVVGIVSAALGPFGGAIVDRYSRRDIIALSDLIGGLAILSLAALIFLFPEATTLSLIWLFVISILLTILGAAFEPAITAIIPDLVPTPRVQAANSFMEIALRIATFVGQGLGGLLLGILGAPLMMVINAGSFLLAAGGEALITPPPRATPPRQAWRQQVRSFLTDTLEGFRYIWQHSGLRALALASAISGALVMPILVLMPFYVEDYLGRGADWYGYLVAAYGFGGLLGALIAGVLPLNGWQRAVFAIGAMVVEAVGYMALGYASPFLVLACAPVIGATGGLLSIIVVTLVQLSTPADLRGRVFAMLGTLAASISPLAAGLTGVIADLTGQNIPVIFLGCGVLLLIVAVVVAFNSDVRRLLVQIIEQETDAIPARP
jgi:Na+/melibiose symporter and related transporters